MDFLLDPFVIALPKSTASAKEVEEYLYSLSEWTQMVVTEGHKFWLSEPIVDVLSSVDLYPGYSDVQKLYARYDNEIELFDASTVSRACQNIFTPPYIDKEIEKQIPEIIELNFVNQTTFVIPDEISKRLEKLGPEVSDALEYTLAKLGYVKETYALELTQSLVFATRSVTATEISVHAKPQGENQLLGTDFEARWEIISEPDQLNVEERLESFWPNTQKALEWAYQALVARGILDEKTHSFPKHWKVGKKFNESIRKNHFDREDLLIKIFLAAAKVLSGYVKATIETDDNHHLVGKNHKQITRVSDNAKAWRIHVSELPNIRLHYWLAKDGFVELSLTCVHEFYNIE